MIDIKGDGVYIDVELSSEWDTSLNNYAGGNKAIVSVKPGYMLTELVDDVHDLKQQVQLMLNERAEEKALREKHPALQDMYNQYSAVLKLVKDHAENSD